MSVEHDQEYIQFITQLRQRIRKLRQEKGWTLEETEEHGWKSWRHLQKIEAGGNFTMFTLWRICKLFKIRPYDLFKK